MDETSLEKLLDEPPAASGEKQSGDAGESQDTEPRPSGTGAADDEMDPTATTPTETQDNNKRGGDASAAAAAAAEELLLKEALEGLDDFDL